MSELPKARATPAKYLVVSNSSIYLIYTVHTFTDVYLKESN